MFIYNEQGQIKHYISIFDESITQIDSHQFKKWFKHSKVVDKSGKPLVVFHGTNAHVQSFNPDKINSIESTGDYVGKGFFFTSNASRAEQYAKQAATKSAGSGINIIPVYLSIQNPLIIASKKDIQKLYDYFGGEEDYYDLFLDSPALLQKKLIEKGYDGLIDKLYNQYAVFKPNQIKSAIGNNGDFNLNSSNINERTSG